MKKFLLSLACLATLSASAGTVTISSDNWTGKFAQDGSDLVADFDGYKVSMIKNTSSSAPVAPAAEMRVYAGSQLKIEAPAGQSMTNIKFTVAKSSKATATSLTLDGSDWSWNTTASTTAGATFDAGSTGSDLFVMNASAQLRTSEIVITYTETEAPAVARPSISFDDETSEVTITCDTEGAEIRWIDNQTDLSVESWNLYDGPFAVSQSTTIYAVALKDGNTSATASLAVTVPVFYTSIADLLAGATSNEVVTYKGVLTFVYGNGQYNYVTDGKDYILLFGNNTTLAGWVNGQTFNGFSGKYTVYNGLPEIAAGYTLGEVGEVAAAVEPEVKTLAELTAADINRYLLLKDMTVEGANLKISNGDEELALYNRFSVELPEGVGYDVTGFYSIYKETYQLYPVEFTGGIVDATPVAPVFTPAGGVIKRITEVTIDGKGFECMYSFNYDEADPDAAEWNEYTGPFTIDDTCVITAYTYNDKGEKSEYVTAEFYYDTEIVDPAEGGEYTFDFASPDTLSPAVEVPTTVSTGTQIDGTRFVSDPEAVAITFAAGEDAGSSQIPVLWLTKNGTEARFYKGSTLTVTANEAYQIAKIEIVGSGNTNLELAEGEAGTYADGVWTLNSEVATQSDEEVVVQSVKFAANQSSGGKVVTSVKVMYEVAPTTGVANVAADNDGVVEYYNLQGVRVANPAAGKLYIKRAGTTVTKVIM